MKRKIHLIASTFLAFVLASGPVKAAEVAIPGTGDGVAVLEAIGKAFTQKENVEVKVPQSIGSGGAVKAVGEGHAILGRVARGIKDKEKDYRLEYKAIFEIPTVIFVNKGVSVDNLTEQQVVEIFSGRISNWKEVGGDDAAITVVRREDKDSSLNNLRKTFPGFQDIEFTKESTLAEKTFIMTAQIANRPNSIGFGPLDVALANDLKVIAINGKQPADTDYPYFGTIGLVYKTSNLDDVSRRFLEFATSEDAKAPIISAGGRPVK